MPIEDRSQDYLKNKEDTAKVLDASDNQWKSKRKLIESKNQTGTVSGHYMMVDNSVFTTADKDDKEAVFNSYELVTLESGNKWVEYVMLENELTKSVVAIEGDCIIMKKDISPSSFTNLDAIKTDHPEVLFVKIHSESGTPSFRLESFKDRERILGFDDNGQPMNTSQVKKTDIACKFTMTDAPQELE